MKISSLYAYCNKNRKNIALAFIVSGLILLVWLAACMSHRIYPFGANTLADSDFEQQVIPFYYHLYDVIHGEKALFFDWYTGLGNNMAGVVSHYALLSPLNLFFLFVARDRIEYVMIWFLALKFIAISLSMLFVLRKIYPKTPAVWTVLFCLLYAFNGFTVQYYTLPMWLDIAALFPLLAYFLRKLLDEGRQTGYIIVLSLIMILSLMEGYMTVFYILIYAGFALLFQKSLGNRKYHAFKLGLSTVTALLLSSVVILPGALQILRSSRLEKGVSILGLFTTVNFTDRTKWLMLFNLGIPLGFYTLHILHMFRVKRARSLFSGFLALSALFLPVVLESSNLLWHMGSYVNFPLRFGYMLVFQAIICGCQYWESCVPVSPTLSIPRKNAVLQSILFTAAGAILLGLSFWILLNNKGFLYIGFSILLSAALSFLIYGKYPKAALRLLPPFILFFQILLLLHAVMPFRDGSSNLLHFVEDSNIIAKANSPSDDALPVLERYKNADSSILSNYPLITRTPSISNYIHLVNPEQIQFDKNMGYSQVWTRMGDMGGTVFSDGLLHTVSSIAATSLNSDLYEYREGCGNYSIYRNRYIYPLGILLKRDAADYVAPSGDDPFYHQNMVSESVVGANLFDIYVSGGTAAAYKLRTESKGILYFYGTGIQNSILSVNGSPVLIPSKDDLHNFLYPTPDNYHNGIVELGTFEAGALNLEINGQFGSNPKIYIAYCPLDRFESYQPALPDSFGYTADKASLQITVTRDADAPDTLLLPVYASDGWKCTVNGKAAGIEPLWGFFMGIPLSEKTDTIKLSFTPPGLWAGIVMSLLGIAAFLLFPLLNRVAMTHRIIKALSNISWWMFAAVESVFLFLVYLLPLLLFIPSVFMH